MPVSAEAIVEEARGFHPSFTRQNIGDLVAVEEVSRLEQELAAAIVEESGESLAEWQQIVWPATALTDGIPIPAHLAILDARVYFTGLVPSESIPVNMISGRQSQSLPQLFPSAYVDGGNVLRLTDQRIWYGDKHGWEDAVRLDVLIVPEISPLTSLASLITLPDQARPTLVRGLALFMSDRVGVTVNRLERRFEEAREAFYKAIIARGSTRSWLVEVVE